MAIRNATNVNKGSQTIAGVPPHYKDTAILRVKKASFGPSKAGLPQMVWECEVVHPLEVTSAFDNNKYSLDSRPINIYLSLSEVRKDGSPSDSLDYIINKLHPLLGLPQEIDDENPNVTQYEGICFQTLLESSERIEQRKKPDGTYEQVKDAEGNPISRGFEWKMIGMKDILKKATATAGRSF